MKVVGIIPARGGSKRLPKKNIADLGGKPLLRWTIDAAIESDIFDDIFVSTEDEEIGAVAGKYWWHRPPELAQDDSPSWPIVLDIAETIKADVFVLLQPTSPFRTATDILAAINMLTMSRGDSVISVTRGPGDLAFQVGHAKRLRSVPEIMVPNGAIYGITEDALVRGENWYSGVLYGYEMPKERSLDIDNGQDLEFARYLVSKQHENGRNSKSSKGMPTKKATYRAS